MAPRPGATFPERRAMTEGMIIGLGNDIVDIRRIEKVLARHGERFVQRVFTEAERREEKGFRRVYLRRTLS